jgi:predicted small secreted protein
MLMKRLPVLIAFLLLLAGFMTACHSNNETNAGGGGSTQSAVTLKGAAQ